MNDHSGTRVLVVEDEFLVRLDLSTHLQEAGYDTIEAGSADDAITVLESDRSIAVVFTDIKMPGTLDGIGLAKHIRRFWPRTIIVIGSANSRSLMDGMPAGCSLFGKPYDWTKWREFLCDLETKLRFRPRFHRLL